LSGFQIVHQSEKTAPFPFPEEINCFCQLLKDFGCESGWCPNDFGNINNSNFSFSVASTMQALIAY
jgi:hypothetical protein